MSATVTFRFYEELNDFLSPDRKKSAFEYHIAQPGSVKDAIEALGIPHTEVDLILVNGQSVDFDYRVRDGDVISVYPVFESMNIAAVTRLRPGPLRNPRFVLDAHLGRLAAYLRMFGFDTLYRNDYDDRELAEVSAGEQRILLTRDKKLLMRKTVTRGYFVRQRLPKDQIREVMRRFDLSASQKPLTRCIHCNGNIHQVDKQAIEACLQPRTRAFYSEFWQCDECGKIYWKGSHYLRMQSLISRIGDKEAGVRSKKLADPDSK